jgi:AcrR family transcriptional regulator
MTARTELMRPFRGVSAADRQRHRRQLLIDTGFDQFGTNGIANVSIAAICAQAQLTKRYFYESFATIDDLVNAVVEHAIEKLAARIVPEIAEGGWRNPRPTLTAAMNAIQEDPRLARLLVVETHSGALTRHRHEFINRAVDMWLAAEPDRTDDPDVLANRRLLAYAYAGAAGEVTIASLDGHLELSPDQVTEQLVLLFQRITGTATL